LYKTTAVKYKKQSLFIGIFYLPINWYFIKSALNYVSGCLSSSSKYIPSNINYQIMKKAPIIAISIMAIILAWLAYNNLQLNNKLKTVSDELSNYKLPIGCNPCKKYSTTPPFQNLDVRMLKDMALEYRNRMDPTFINNHPSLKDAETIWFSLDSLKRFIWQIETTVCKNKCGDATKNLDMGLRIYYARYPTTGNQATYPQLKGVDPTYKDMHTVFMVPTYDNMNGTVLDHIDFDPSKFDAAKCRYIGLDSTVGTVMAFGGFYNQPAQATGSSSTTAKNHGTLCPPICGTDTFFR
jgi:hypothetical protein